MRLGQRLCALGRAGNRRVREDLVALYELARIPEGRHHQPPVAIGLVVELGAGGNQPRRAAGRQQRRVEPLVQNVERRLALAETIGFSAM